MAYMNKNTGDYVELERWRWQAIYNDGTELHQFDESSGEFHSFYDIDQERLSVFRMVNSYGKACTLLFKEGMRLIHFYRNQGVKTSLNQDIRVKLYVFGYETDTDKRLFIITPEDELVIAGEVNEFNYVIPVEEV